MFARAQIPRPEPQAGARRAPYQAAIRAAAAERPPGRLPRLPACPSGLRASASYTLLKWFGLDSYMADSLDILRM